MGHAACEGEMDTHKDARQEDTRYTKTTRRDTVHREHETQYTQRRETAKETNKGRHSTWRRETRRRHRDRGARQEE